MTGQESRPAPRHLPVLPQEVIHFLAPKPGQTIVDATVGGGGHAQLLSRQVAPSGRIIGLDRDAAMLQLARPGLQDLPVTLIQRNFDELPALLAELKIPKVDGILADLGVCSDQLDDPGRGLSFQKDGPLDMRLDAEGGETAGDLLRRLPERELADILWKYGEERFSRRIAKKVVEGRKTHPLETTGQLADLVRRCVPRERGRRHAFDPATRTFQALRIAVNDELGALERFLANLPECLKAGGRVVVISFHSLEDRLVKQAFRNKDRFVLLTRKPIVAGAEEIRNNPRARSAKLRAASLAEEERS